MYKPLVMTLSLVAAVSLSACSSDATDADMVFEDDARAETGNTAASARPAASRPAPAPVCSECGTVSSIEPIKIKGEGSGAGAVGGAVLGGVAGNQIGGGSGNKIATVVGAIGGGYAGHKAEEHMRSSTIHRVTVRMESGGTRTIDVADASYLSAGQKVSVFGDTISVRN